jgi:ABC-type Fe3+-hydroxamate transport system substrate-binding protein
MNARRMGVLLVALLALVAAGCGGGGSNEASSDTSTAVSESTTEEMTTTADTTTTESSSDTTDADMSALTGRCAQLAGLGSKLAASMSGQEGDVQDVSKLFDEVADQVPDEIKADWQVLADNFSKIADALKGTDLSSGTPNAETLAKLQKLASSLDSQKVQQAAAHIEAWAKKNC